MDSATPATQAPEASTGQPRTGGAWLAGQVTLLAGVWGLAYLFFRIGGKDFGPVPAAWLRMVLAAACLLPGVLLGGHGGCLRRHWRALLVVGALNFALPFVFYAYALQVLDIGIASILNATAPLSTAVIASLWLGERLTPLRATGLAVGFGGVMLLTWQHHGIAAGAVTGLAQGSVVLGYTLCIGATLLYGFAASYTRRHLEGVPPSVIAAGSLLVAAVLLTPPGIALWPAQVPPLRAWVVLVLLGVVCTAWAFATYFRLLGQVGPSRTMATTYLTPPFAMAWGWVWLDEVVTWPMLAAGGVILLGTALGSGALARPQRP